MDVHGFAVLSRRTVDAITRRTSLLALGTAGLATALVGASGAEAGKNKKKKVKKKCDQDKQQCRAQIEAFCAEVADPQSCEDGFLPCCATCKVGSGIICVLGRL